MTTAQKNARQFLQKLRDDEPEERDLFRERFEAQPLIGNSAFHGMFGESRLSDAEEEALQQLLYDFFDPSLNDEEQIHRDLRALCNIGAEVRAIAHQSLLLQGERIQQAQKILKRYREGAFTQWLIATYGNRRTPYSYLQYYEFYQQLPTTALKTKMESMPRQAAYALASRPGEVEEKAEIVEAYQGQPQRELIALIQERFPNNAGDQRSNKLRHLNTLRSMHKLCEQLPSQRTALTYAEKESILRLIERLKQMI